MSGTNKDRKTADIVPINRRRMTPEERKAFKASPPDGISDVSMLVRQLAGQLKVLENCRILFTMLQELEMLAEEPLVQKGIDVMLRDIDTVTRP